MGLCNSLVAACFAFYLFIYLFLPGVSKKASENTHTHKFLFSFHNKTCDVNPFTLKTAAACSEIPVHLRLSVHLQFASTWKLKPLPWSNLGQEETETRSIITSKVQGESGLYIDTSKSWPLCIFCTEDSENHRFIEPFKLEKTSKII